jgi:maltooligosyltrehalose trehalohydrolase
MRPGADYRGGDRCDFAVWAPFLEKVGLKILSPAERLIAMEKDERGYWRASVGAVSPGTTYFYRLEDTVDRPDPASDLQIDGVHGASIVVDHLSFAWEDAGWSGIPIEQMIIYELHVGTFTSDGTFDAVIERIDDLIELGVNAIELMPVAQFPGERNWGYDGVYPFAAQASYGGPEALRRLINSCHRSGIAVILDVVYNHLGPEGNYLDGFGPYFTDKYRTPWGKALNFDGRYSDGVRNFFLENARHWFDRFHIDGLRLDAVHEIFDQSAKPFLAELAGETERFSAERGRRLLLIAESNLNDVRLIRPRESGGYGLDAQWCDDFHHSLRTLISSERGGYYVDFGDMRQLRKSFEEGFVYSGQYSEFRKKHHGSSSADRPANQFVVFSRNHDQVGNRLLGERPSTLVPFEATKLAAGAVLLSPYVPLLFMGEEYGEPAPFLYFISHGDPELIEAVRRGRKDEFKEFAWAYEPPDPQGLDAFLRSKLRWELRNEGVHRQTLNFYRRLIQLRRSIPALANSSKADMVVTGEEGTILVVRRRHEASSTVCIMNFNDVETAFSPRLPTGVWKTVLDSADLKWGGPGSRLPERVKTSSRITLSPLSISLFLLEQGE